MGSLAFHRREQSSGLRGLPCPNPVCDVETVVRPFNGTGLASPHLICLTKWGHGCPQVEISFVLLLIALRGAAAAVCAGVLSPRPASPPPVSVQPGCHSLSQAPGSPELQQL